MDETAKDQTPELSKICTEDKAENIQREYSSLAMPLSNSCENLNLDTQVKFTLKKARTLDKHTLTDEKLTSPDQIPEYILKNLMIVNYHAREFELTSITKNNDKKKSKINFDSYESEDDDETNDSNSDENEGEDDVGINPMDGLLWVFHCSDISLRRDLAIKLSACQLSVPFFLPDPAAPSTNVTMLLSALENITKSWRGASNNHETAQEVFATEYPFPVVSFIRIGKSTMSKSSLMNKIMSDANGNHDFFFHRNIQGGDVRRKVVDGLVELSWYLPGGGAKQTLRKEICFANLRGDAKRFKKQIDVLLNISSVVCILLSSEYPDEKMTTILNEATQIKAKVILIFNERMKGDTKKYFNELKKEHGKLSLITNAKKPNEYSFLQAIRENIQNNIHEGQVRPLVDLASCATSEYGIQLDYDQSSVKFEKILESWLKMGTKEAKNYLKLQMHVPRFADLERKKYSPKRRCKESKPDGINRDVDEVYKDIEVEKEAQRESFKALDKSFLRYFNYIAVVDETEQSFHLSKIKHQLDKMSLQDMANLHQQYRVASLNLQKKKRETYHRPDTRFPEEKHLKHLEESISDCSFGLEHIFREFAQLYELPDITTIDYAGAAAELLLSGQPLELLDGDSCYIPLRWFDAVYRQLECKTNNAKIFVISVLGIQSSGKSTMLNTMFGLEFPVSAGRCTRGAFVSLIPVGDSLKSTSNIDYVLVIDTEGFKGSRDPQLREHDNELATFAIGLADVTIVNIFGDNHHEMTEFLEIAVHAFLKMKLVKEKKTCKIVHQNVAAMTVERVHLKQNLNKMAIVAAIQENCEDKFRKFDDIVSFDENEDVFYIPSLLKGSPPMAPVNPNYARAIQKLKENIITLMSGKERAQLSVSLFRDKVINLWRAMLKENFIFSFRNTIEVRAYTSLDRKYFKESVNFMVMGMAEVERKIQVALSRWSTRDEREQKWELSKREIREQAEKLGMTMEKEMKIFFETSEDKATLEQWKENVMNKIVQFKENQLMAVTQNCQASFEYWQNQQDAEEMKQTYEKKLLQRARNFITSAHNTDDIQKCKRAFEQEWQQWIVDVPECQERKKDINGEMIEVLCQTMPVLNAEITGKLKKEAYAVINFKEMAPVIDSNQLSIGKLSKWYNYITHQEQEVLLSAGQIQDKAVESALDFAKMKSKSGVRYTINDLKHMYYRVITTIDNETEKQHFKFTRSLKCDILLYTFANAYVIFDEMEERYIQERDIRVDLQRNLRPRLESYFLNLCSEMKKDVLVATSIVGVLQRPVKLELSRTMVPAVTGELLTKTMYQSKGQFHANVLIDLGEECKFESYVPYLKNPIKFLKHKLTESIKNYCLNEKPASINFLLECEAKKIKEKLFFAISRASKLTRSGSEKLNFWIQRFVESLSTLEITKEMFAVAAINEDLKDIDVFEAKLRIDVEEFLESLIKRGVDKATIQKWNPSPQDSLFTWMFGCQCCCPFCEALCDQTVQDHVGNHSTRIHRPRGLTGYKQTKKLDHTICTTDVASETTFQKLATSGAWHQHKNYQTVNDYYKSWTIPPDPSFEASTYWQWFMATFSKELAKHYEAKKPEIPSAWKKLKFSEVKEQLRREYNI